MNFRLSIQMLREHRWSYAGLAVVLVLAAALTGVSLLVARAASAKVVDTNGLTRNQVAIRLGYLASGSDVANFMVFLSVFVVAVLVFQIVGFMVDGRRRELALLRLGGAARWQVIAMLIGETLLIAIGASLVGSLVALGTVGPFAQLLSLSNNWPAGLPVGVHPDALLWCFVLVPVAAVAGSLVASARVARMSPVDALGVADEPTDRRLPIARLIVAGLAIVAIVVLLLLPVGGGGLLALPSAVGACAVLVASALAPLVVPVVGQPLSIALTAIAPGAGLVAWRRTRFDNRRTGALATPIIILLGLGAVFGMFAMTGRAYNATAYQSVKNTQAVAEISAPQAHSELFTRAKALPEVGEITRLQSTKEWSWGDTRVPKDVSLAIEAIDPTTFADFVPARVFDGSLKHVYGTGVAVVTPTQFRIGDSFAIVAPGGRRVQVHVVAVVEGTTMVNSSLLVDYHQFAITDPVSTQTWLVHAAKGVENSRLDAALVNISPSVVVRSRGGWIQEQVDRLVGTLGAAIFTIVGGAAIFTLVGLALAIIASSRERSREFQVLRVVGARARSVVASVAMESVIACVTAIVLGCVIVAFVYVRMDSALTQTGIDISPVFPVDVVLWITGLCIAVAVSSAALGAGLALRTLRRSHV